MHKECINIYLLSIISRGESECKYSCESCHYNTSDRYDYNKDLLTLKYKDTYTFYTLSGEM